MKTNKPIILPDYIEASIALRYKGAGTDKIEEVRALWAKQLELNEKQAVQIDAAAMQDKLTRANAYMGTYIKHEDMGGGVSSNRTNLLGGVDGNFARFYTPSASQAAQIIGELSSTFTTSSSHTAELNIVAKKGPSSSNPPSGVTNYNRVTVWVNETMEDWKWKPVGTTSIITTPNNATYIQWYRVGTLSISGTWKNVVVETNTLIGSNPPAPGATQYNDVMVDCIVFTYI
ncbi:MAG: hypothetical protein LBH74_07910 [Nitrososphaerota archaeon]|jgi:hypothetical protein|nr:hypothetical protein [Nitrososphaerota archaeon]